MKQWILMLAVLAFFLGCDQSNLEALANGGYTVSYDANTATSGKVPTSAKVYRSGATFVIPGNLGNLAKPGHTLVGWATSATGGGKIYVAGVTFEVTGSVTLYARWLPNTYTVSFNSQGGTAVPSESALYGSKVQTPTQPSLSGSGFGGWYREAQAINSWNFNNDTITGDLILFAKWVSNGYTVTFNSLGGTAVDSLAVSSGGLLVRPADPTRSGQSFVGWYKEPGLSTAWNFASDTVTTNLTLYAKWTVISHTVIFQSQGTTYTTVTVNEGAKMSAPTTPVLAGSTFVGWYQEPTLTTPWDFPNAAVTSDLTLYAKWTAVAKTFSEVAPTSLKLKTASVSVAGSPQTHYYSFSGPAAYNADKTKSYPLVIYLHAWGPSNDPAKIGDGSPGTYSEILQSLTPTATNPAFVYVPVCPPPYLINNEPEAPDGGEWNSPAAKAMVVAQILDLQARFNIDPKRIYLAGWSMGGAGSWYIGDAWYQATGKPFAAVVRGAGWWLAASREPRLAAIQESMSHMSSWIHVGALDTNGQIKWSAYDVAQENYANFKALYSSSEDLASVRSLNYQVNGSPTVVQTDYKRLVLKTGAELRLSVYRGQEHNGDLLFLDPAVIPWMFAQHLP